MIYCRSVVVVFKVLEDLDQLNHRHCKEQNRLLRDSSVVQGGVDSVPLESESRDPEDIEDILDSLGSDIGAHLDDTLDGIQVGQFLDICPWICPTHTRFYPVIRWMCSLMNSMFQKMTESDLNRFNQNDTLDELDAGGFGSNHARGCARRTGASSQ